MTKHIPGPWLVDWDVSEDGPMVGTHRGLSVAQTYHSHTALLIAAAPELLELLKEVVSCGPNVGHNTELLVKITAAISKAEGDL